MRHRSRRPVGRRRRLAACVLLPLALGACGADSKWADDASVQAARYRHDGPPSITLFTAYNTRGGEGAHSGLMINADERILFDPAGSWWNPAVPERNDVHFGLSPPVEEVYIDFHARPSYYVLKQEVPVPPEIARLAAERAKANGPASKAFCSNSISAVLSGVPGFETVDSWFPGKLAADFAALPGVISTYYHDDDVVEGNGLRVTVRPDPSS